MKSFVVRQKTWVVSGIIILFGFLDLMLFYVWYDSEKTIPELLLLVLCLLVSSVFVYCFSYPRIAVSKHDITVYRPFRKKRKYKYGNIRSVRCTRSLAENGEVIWLTYSDGKKLSVSHYHYNYQKFRKVLLQNKSIEWI